MEVFIEHGIDCHKCILLFQEDGPNDIMGCTFLLIPQEYGHKFWVCIITMINDHIQKVTHDLGHTQFINSINYDHYEKFMSYNNITNNIIQKGDK